MVKCDVKGCRKQADYGMMMVGKNYCEAHFNLFNDLVSKSREALR